MFRPTDEHAVNLAVLRIIVFGLLATWSELPRVPWFAGLPEQLRFVPPGASPILEVLPVSPTVATIASTLFVVASIFATIGFHTRTSAVVTVIVALFVMLIPQLYAKVNHYHHLVWFGALLSVSPCGDALSVDRWLSKRDLGLNIPRSSTYYWPLAGIMFLMGIIYFFPGFWKLAIAGPEWALSDNLKFQMFAKWFELGGWEPFFRLDAHPIIYKTVGSYVILFELTFMGLILHRWTRRFAALGGVVFHVGTGVFMNIWFGTLLACYAVFVDWRQLIGRHSTSSPTNEVVGPRNGASDLSVQTPRNSGRNACLATVLVILTLANVASGSVPVVHGWPFAAYPAFVPAKTDPVTSRIQLTMMGTTGGGEETISTRMLKRKLSPPRYSALNLMLLSRGLGDRRDDAIRAYAHMAIQESGRVPSGIVRAYQVDISTIPEAQGRVLGRRKLYEWRVDSLWKAKPP